MARTALTEKQLRNAVFDKTKLEALQVMLSEFCSALDALEGGTTSSVVTIHPVRGASTGNIADLAACSTTFDGLTLVAGNRILLKDQSSGGQNGIYVVGTVGAGTAPLTRATDFDAGTEVKPGTLVSVAAGTANASTYWSLTNTTTPTVGSTSLTFGQIYNAAQAGAVGRAIYKKTVTVGEADLSGTSQVVNIGTALPANAVVLGHEIVVNVQGVLAGNDLSIKVGGTDDDAIVASTDLDALAAGSYQGTLGVHPRGSFASQQLVATFAASDLASLSAGNWTFNVWYITLA